jgi:hypothetical protein
VCVSRLPKGRSLVGHRVAEAPYAPSVPPPASMDADDTPTPISIHSGDLPSGQEPTAVPSVPSGSPEYSLLVRLDEDVSALRMEIGVSRAREENLFERVKPLEALVATLRGSVLKPSAVASHRDDIDNDVMREDEEVEEDEEDEVIDVKPSGMLGLGLVLNRRLPPSSRYHESGV